MQRFIRIDRESRTDRYRLSENAVVELEILRGEARQRLRRIEVPVFLIGTADDCDLVVGDASIPQVHTYLYVRPEGVSIRTLGAAPSLTVGGRVAENAMLTDGDRFGIGPFEFLLHIREGAGPEGDQRRRRGDQHRVEGEQRAEGDQTIGGSGFDGLQAGGLLDAAGESLDVVRQTILVSNLRVFVEPLHLELLAWHAGVVRERASA
ncbi:MAG: FHA domain-containing protein [Pirellulaceae bacterium]